MNSGAPEGQIIQWKTKYTPASEQFQNEISKRDKTDNPNTGPLTVLASYNKYRLNNADRCSINSLYLSGGTVKAKHRLFVNIPHVVVYYLIHMACYCADLSTLFLCFHYLYSDIYIFCIIEWNLLKCLHIIMMTKEDIRTATHQHQHIRLIHVKIVITVG